VTSFVLGKEIPSKTKKIIKRGSIIKMGVAFGAGDRILFRAEFQMSTPSGGAIDGKTIIVRFFSFCHESICSVIEEVTCCSYNQEDDSSLTEQTKMSQGLTHDGRLLQMFEAHSYILFPGPFTIKFRVEMRSTVENFTNKLVDSALSEQLWDAIVDRKMTDVEFLVGEESFGCHRSLLSARSPVFAAMFTSGMNEAETGQVKIEDVDPTTLPEIPLYRYVGAVVLY